MDRTPFSVRLFYLVAATGVMLVVFNTVAQLPQSLPPVNRPHALKGDAHAGRDIRSPGPAASSASDAGSTERDSARQ
jgi:hypothetical protein